jgi:hypothetical protein
VTAATRWSPKPSTVAMAGVGLAALARRTAAHAGARGRYQAGAAALTGPLSGGVATSTRRPRTDAGR